MNYIQIFAKGGRTKATAQDEANVMLQVLDSIGIDQETATNKLSELAEANDADTMNQIKQAINTIVKGQNDPAAQGAIKEATDFLYNTFSQSQLFKCGGKLAQKAKKKMSGGKVDCGCKGTKIGKHQEGGLVLPKNDPIRNFMIQKDSTWINNGIPGREIVIASPDKNGNAFSLRVQGRDSTATAGMIDNGKYIANGEIDVKPGYLDKWIKYILSLGKQGNPTKSMQDGGLVRASGYYKNHADEGIIRKIQTFLAGHGYNIGNSGIDGKFGKDTYNAIRQYQRDNGLKDDGMWGENTNSVHMVLGGRDTTFNGPRSGAHPGTRTMTENFVNQPYVKSIIGDASQQRDYLNTITSRAYVNPEWFWGDDEDASIARQYLYNLKNNGQDVGVDFIKDIYTNWTSPELQQKINQKKLPKEIVEERFNNNIRKGTNEAAKDIAKQAGIIAGGLAGTEGIFALSKALSNVAKVWRGIWNPVQARVGTGYSTAANGALRENATGAFASEQGLNMGQFAPGTDYAQTILKNLRAITPVGLKKGGKIK